MTEMFMCISVSFVQNSAGGDVITCIHLVKNKIKRSGLKNEG